MYTYLVVFQYTKNCHLFVLNKIITLELPFCEDDVETQEKIASEKNEHKTWIINIIPIEPSRKPPE